MSYTAQERKIAYNIALGDKAQLFTPISVKGQPTFSLQFYLSAIAGVIGTDSIRLKISNADTDTPPPDSEFYELPPPSAGGLIYNYGTSVAAAGSSTRYIFVGTAEGVGNCTWVTASFVKGGLTGGTIDKAILAAQLGNQ